MHYTNHMAERMQQRSLGSGPVVLTMLLGESNDRGDQVTVGREELDELIQGMRRALKDAERLRRRGGATVVLVGDSLITVYDRSRKNRRRPK